MATWERLAMQKQVIREADARDLRAIDMEGGAGWIAPARDDRAIIPLARAGARRRGGGCGPRQARVSEARGREKMRMWSENECACKMRARSLARLRAPR